MQLCFLITDTLSHNIISHKRDEPITNLFRLERTLNSLSYRIAELCKIFREKIYPARDTGRRKPIPGLSRGIRDGWQPYELDVDQLG